MYVNRVTLSKIFCLSPMTVRRRIEGIEKEIGKRYNRYAVVGKLVSAEVFADYEKYREFLGNKNLRKTVPPFDMQEASTYLNERTVEEKRRA